MRIAHLILTHKGPAQLARLIGALAHEDFDFYIHLDKKVDISQFDFLQGCPNVYFTTTRIDVRWGGYSLTKVVLDCTREILNGSRSYDFINVLSAQDYPIKPLAVIHAFFRQHLGLSFLEYEEAGSAWWQAHMSRLEQYHLTELSFPGRYGLQALLARLLPRRKFPLPYTLYGGNMGGWYALSWECARYVLAFLEAHPQVRRFAFFTWGSDEFLIHTILLNSPLKARIINNNLRYIDWSAGGASPKTFTQADLPALQASDRLFARKFDSSQDSAILDLLDAVIK